MKKIYTLVMCIVIACNGLFAQINDRIVFSISHLEFTTTNGYTKVSLNDCFSMKEVGAPELPYMTVSYVIPFDKKVSSISIIDSTSQSISGVYNIYPAQPEHYVNEPPPPFVEPNDAIYNGIGFYPSILIEISNQYYNKGYHIVTLNIYPLSYIPKEKSLKLFTSIEFTLNYENEPNMPTKPKSQSAFMYDIVKRQITSIVRNSSDIDQMDSDPSMITSTSNKSSMSRSSIQVPNFGNKVLEYIIITNDKDVNGATIPVADNGKSMTRIFKDLADWKTKKGTPTIVVTVDDIKKQATGCDLQEQIHNFLKDIYSEYGTIYVLFGGDVNIIPTRSVIYGSKLYSTDLYYTSISNNWNANGNNIFGEYGDNVVNSSNFYFGRAPVENGKEAVTFVNKVIGYEKLSNCANTSYINNDLFVTGYLLVETDTNGIKFPLEHSILCIKDVDDVAKSITQPNIKKWRLYDEFQKNGGNQTLNRSNFLSNLSSGQQFGKFHIVYHMDHSSFLNMGASALWLNQTLSRGDMDGLSNNNYWQILYTNGCEPGQFDKDCIVEHYLNNPTGGGVAAIASSDMSGSSEVSLFKKIVNQIYETSTGNPTNFNIGIVHDNSITSTDTWYKRKNHLFGDPEMPIWTETPRQFANVSLSTTSITNINNSLTITVSNLYTQSIKVCLYKEGEIYDVKWSWCISPSPAPPYTKTLTFNVEPQTAGNLSIVITAHNYRELCKAFSSLTTWL